jgi:hypothetical protein
MLPKLDTAGQHGPDPQRLPLYFGPQSFCMSQNSSRDGKEEFLSVKKTDLERIMGLLTKLAGKEAG